MRERGSLPAVSTLRANGGGASGLRNALAAANVSVKDELVAQVPKSELWVLTGAPGLTEWLDMGRLERR